MSRFKDQYGSMTLFELGEEFAALQFEFSKRGEAFEAARPEALLNDREAFKAGIKWGREMYPEDRKAVIDECRKAVLDTGMDAHEAAKAKDATDYIAGYQDCAVDCDEALRDLCAPSPRGPIVVCPKCGVARPDMITPACAQLDCPSAFNQSLPQHDGDKK